MTDERKEDCGMAEQVGELRPGQRTLMGPGPSDVDPRVLRAMATPLVSLLGVEEIVTLSRQAMEAEDNHPELLMPFYGFCLVIFFAYCYPIARWTIRLERRYSVKL